MKFDFSQILSPVLENDLNLMIQMIPQRIAVMTIAIMMMIPSSPYMNDHHLSIVLRELSRFFFKRKNPKCVK